MNTRMYASLASLLTIAAVTAAGCKTSSPAQPSSTGSGGTSIIAPTPITPTNGSTVAYVSLPAKFTVSNGTSTSGSPLTYTFEVAYDAAFNSKVTTKTAVAEGSNGQTTTTIDSLLSNNTYYWHVRADGGGTTGVFSPAYQFKIGGQVTLSAPAAVSPVNNGFVTSAGQTFVSSNVTKTGPAGAITYKFEISTSPSFATTIASGTVPEGAGQTSYNPGITFTPGVTYYWRVTASDLANGVSTVSATNGFGVITSIQALLAAEEGVSLWPGVQPPGTNGHSTLGDNWDVQRKVSFGGVPYLSPQIEALQIFDLMDRGMAPGDAINWMKANGYNTVALYYDYASGGKPLFVIGINYQYLAAIKNGVPDLTGQWNLVDRNE